MFGLPADFDGAVFRNREIIEGCFSANTVAMLFGEDLQISLRGPYSYRVGPDGPVGEYDASSPTVPSYVTGLAGKEVESVRTEADGSLVLGLSDGSVFTCLDSFGYESYLIYIGDREIIV